MSQSQVVEKTGKFVDVVNTKFPLTLSRFMCSTIQTEHDV